MNGFMKKPYGIRLPLLLTWEDKDIPEVVAQIGGPAPARRSRHKLAAERCRCYVLRRLPLPAPAKYRQNHDGVANCICGGCKFTPTKVWSFTVTRQLAFIWANAPEGQRRQCMLTTCLRGVPKHHSLTTSPGHVCPPRMTFLGPSKIPTFQAWPTHWLPTITSCLEDFAPIGWRKWSIGPWWSLATSQVPSGLFFSHGWNFHGAITPRKPLRENHWTIPGPGDDPIPSSKVVPGRVILADKNPTESTNGWNWNPKSWCFFFLADVWSSFSKYRVYFFRFQPLVLREVSCQNPGN